MDILLFQSQHFACPTYLAAMQLWFGQREELAELKKLDRASYDSLYAWCKADLRNKDCEGS